MSPVLSTRARAAAGSLAFLILVPGVVAGAVPLWLARSGSAGAPVALRVLGVALVAGGVALLVWAFVSFVLDGAGTPAPIAPTERLVVTGLYRYVRNPMYLAVLAVILGQALITGRPVLYAYAAGFFAVVTAFVLGHEEPALARRYGAEYAAYRAGVRRWVPRLRPWSA